MNIFDIFFEKHYDFLKYITSDFKFFSISELTFVLFLPIFFVFIIFILSFRFKIIPGFFQTMIELLYYSVYKFVKPYCHGYDKKYAKYIVGLFFYILFLNFLNLIPFLPEVTSQVFVNLTISSASIIAILLINIFEHGIYFYRQFIPEVPNFIKPFLFIMEFFLFLLKAVTLALRLSIAMGIGHLLLHVISSLKLGIFGSSLIVFILSSIITLIEISVAILQAYIFTLFICLSVSDMLKKH